MMVEAEYLLSESTTRTTITIKRRVRVARGVQCGDGDSRMMVLDDEVDEEYP